MCIRDSTDTDRLVAQGPSPGPTMGSVYDGSYSYSYADSSSAKSPSYRGSYSYSYVYSYSYANSRRDRRLTFDSDSGSPPWHRLWEKTWHHYCVTYAAVPKEKGRPRNVTFYVDGVAEDTWKATVNTSLGSPLYIGADVQGSKTLDGAVDEVYVYEDALDAWQVGVLYGIISPPPTALPTGAPTSAPTGLPTPEPSPAPTSHPSASPAPSRYFLEAALVAHYGMDGGVAVDDHGAFGNATYVEGRTRKDTALDGTDALNVTGARKGVRLPAGVTRRILGGRERGVCLWARVDKWRKAALFGYGAAATGESATGAPAKPGAFGLAGADDVGKVALDFGDGYPVKAEVPARAGQWHHYCLVYDDGNATLYYDSVIQKTTKIALNTSNSSPFHLGAGSVSYTHLTLPTKA